MKKGLFVASLKLQIHAWLLLKATAELGQEISGQFRLCHCPIEGNLLLMGFIYGNGLGHLLVDVGQEPTLVNLLWNALPLLDIPG